MTILAAIFLGLIQGIAEFLPISSSGHLSIFQNFFGLNTAEEGHLFFDVLLHLATLVSVCIVYRHDIADMFRELAALIRESRHPEPREGKPSPSRRLILMIVVATLPLLIVIPFKGMVEQLYYNTIFIGCALLLTGVLLFVSDKMVTGRKTEKNMGVKDAIVVGICQAIAIIPGLSRSGSTITGGMATGLDREFAVKFSFLISVPAILGANILTLVDAIKEGIDMSLMPAYLVGMTVAGVSGYFAIGLVRMLSKKGKFGKFAYYCWAVGIITIFVSIIF